MTDAEREELTAMLPFYINGTLDMASRARVEAALRHSPELTEALTAERAIAARVQEGTNTLLTEAEADMPARAAGVMARTAHQSAPDADPDMMADADAGRGGLMQALSILNPRRWSPAVALSLAAAVPMLSTFALYQGATIAALKRENYELASGQAGAHDRAQGIIIEFKDTANWAAIVALLDEHALTVVDSGGFGVLTVDCGVKGAERAKIIDALRANAIVVRAEPEA